MKYIVVILLIIISWSKAYSLSDTCLYSSYAVWYIGGSGYGGVHYFDYDNVEYYFAYSETYLLGKKPVYFRYSLWSDCCNASVDYIPYFKSTFPYHKLHINQSITVQIKVDDPIDVEAYFVDYYYDRTNIESVCPGDTILTVETMPFNDNGSNSYKLYICVDTIDTWQLMDKVPKPVGSMFEFKLNDLVTKYAYKRGQPIKFKTEKRLKYYEQTDIYTYAYSLIPLRYLEILFAADIVIKDPVCNESLGPELKMPIPDGKTLKFEVKINELIYSFVDEEDSSLNSNEYILKYHKEGNTAIVRPADATGKQIDPGTYQYDISYMGKQTCPLTYSHTLTYPPQLVLDTANMPRQTTDDFRHTIHIPKIGGEETFTMSIAKSQRDQATLHAYSNEYCTGSSVKKTVTLNSSGGVYYYNEDVPVTLTANKYYMRAENSDGCISNVVEVELTELPKFFGSIKVNDACPNDASYINANNGEISITMEGGFKPFNISSPGLRFTSSDNITYTAKNIKGNSTSHTITITDEEDNRKVVTAKVGTHPTIPYAISETPKAPTMSCSSDGELVIVMEDYGSGYSCSSDNTSYTMDEYDVTLYNYKAGPNFYYTKDKKTGCIAKRPIDIPETPAMNILNSEATINKPSCYNSKNGSFSGKVHNVHGIMSIPFEESNIDDSYLKKIGDNTVSAEQLSHGNYYFRVIDKLGSAEDTCGYYYSFTIPNKNQISISYTEHPVPNKGKAEGSCDLYIKTSNTGMHTANLYDDISNNPPTALYTKSFNVTDPTENNKISFSGLTGTYNEGSGKIYYVDVVDDLCECSYYKDHTKNYLAFPIIEPESTLKLELQKAENAACKNGNGSVVLKASGGWTEEYKYKYNQPGNDFQPNNNFSVPAGTHTFIVTDKYGGTDTLEVTITEPPLLQASFKDKIDVACFGESTGSITFNVSGGTYPYSFKDEKQAYDLIAKPDTDTLLTATLLSKNTYALTVIDKNYCEAQKIEKDITQPPLLELEVTDRVHTSCEKNNGSISTRAKGGTAPYTFTWQNDTITILPDVSIAENSLVTKLNLAPGQHYIKVTDTHACKDSTLNAINIKPYTNPQIAKKGITDVTCYDETNGEAWVDSMAVSSRGILYFELSTIDSSLIYTNKLGKFNQLAANTYYLKAIDSMNCVSEPKNIDIFQPDTILQVFVDSVNSINAKDSATGFVFGHLSGGNNGEKKVRLFNKLGVLIDSTVCNMNNLFIFNSLFANDYYIQISDIKGCTAFSSNFSIIEPEIALSLLIEQQNVPCKGLRGRFKLSGIGGWGNYTYCLSDTGNFYSTQKFDAMAANNYLVKVKDKRGVIFTDTVYLTEPADSAKVTVADIIVPTCPNNGRLLLNIAGGTAPYSLIANNTTDTIHVASAQTLWLPKLDTLSNNIQLLDANQCRSNLTVSLPDTQLLKVSHFEYNYPSDRLTPDGALSVFTQGGAQPFNYTWKLLYGDTLNTSTAYKIEHVPTGYYKVFVHDTQSCTVSQIGYLPAENDIELEQIFLQDETSSGANNGWAKFFTSLDSLHHIEIQGSVSVNNCNITDSISYFYENNDTLILKNLPPGDYGFTAVNKLGLQAYAQFSIQPYELMYFDKLNASNARCIGEASGKIVSLIKGGAGKTVYACRNTDSLYATYQTFMHGDTCIIPNIAKGIYIISGTDKFNNVLSDTIRISEPDSNLHLYVSEYYNQTCNEVANGYLILNAYGGWQNFRFKHEKNGAYSTQTIYKDLESRKHTFYVRDNMGVEDSLRIEIRKPEKLTADIRFVDSVKCFEEQTGNIAFNLSGGTTPYRYKYAEFMLDNYWVTDTIARNFAQGQYTFMFTDKNGCVGHDTLSVYLNQPDLLQVNTVKIKHTTCGLNNGALLANVIGGTRPYSYKWVDIYNNFLGADSVISSLKKNNEYALLLTDAHNCKAEYSELINGSYLPTIEKVNTHPTLCFGDSTGKAEIGKIVTAIPFAPYNFAWSNADTGLVANNLPMGYHYVVIKDTNNCSSKSTFYVGTPAPININLVSFYDAHCYGYHDGQINVNAVGGAGNYKYNWTSGSNTAQADSLKKGFYTVVVTDSNNCSYERSYIVSEPNDYFINIGEDVKICPGNTITVDGFPFAEHLWTTKEGFFSDEQMAHISEQNEYYLRVANDSGCFAYDTIAIAVGNDWLQADFLMTSEANLGDTLTIYEISNRELDSLFWEYDSPEFTDITPADAPNYMFQLQNNQLGYYNVTLWAYASGCVASSIKQIEIVPLTDTVNNFGYLGYKDPLIQNFVLAPNPNDGTFTVFVSLREEADIELSVFNISFGLEVDRRQEQGLKEYELAYELSHLNTGVYLLTLSARNERKQIKMIIE